MEISLSLYNSAKSLGMYAYAVGGEDVPLARLTDAAVRMYAKERLQEDLANRTASGLKQGIDGISLARSFVAPGEIHLRADYVCHFPFFSIGTIRLKSECAVHPWTGYQGENQGEGGGQTEKEMVYVAENGEVYHKQKDCSHLKLSVKKTDRRRVGQMQNAYGQRYRPCEKCAAGDGGELICYVTDQGDCYHVSGTCPGLKRTVRWLAADSVSELSPCS